LQIILRAKEKQLASKASQRIVWWSGRRWYSVISIIPELTEEQPLWRRSDESLVSVRLFGLTPEQLQEEIQHYWEKPRWQQWLLKQFTFINKKIEIWFYYQKCLAFREIRYSKEMEFDKLNSSAQWVLAELEKWLSQQEIAVENHLDKRCWDLSWTQRYFANVVSNVNYQKINFLKKLAVWLEQVVEDERKEVEVLVKANYEKIVKKLSKYHYFWSQKVFGSSYSPPLETALASRPERNIITFEQVLEFLLRRATWVEKIVNHWVLESLYVAGIFTQENFAAIRLHPNPNGVVKALESLYAGGILTQENFRAIVAIQLFSGPRAAAKALKFLHREGLLTPENRAFIQAHPDPSTITQALKFLRAAGVCTQENFAAIQLLPNSCSVSCALQFLYDARILTQENFATILSYPDPRKAAYALECLDYAEMLTQENFDAVVRLHPDVIAIARAFRSLYAAGGPLTPENKIAILSHPDPMAVAEELKFLHAAKILTPENIAVIQPHSEPGALASATKFLYAAGILTQENFEIIRLHSEKGLVANALLLLNAARILTQENFSALFESNCLLIGGIWDRIPIYLMTLEVFNELLQRARQVNPEQQILAYVNQLLILNQIDVINDIQSTHTESVHQSISESAARLLIRYSQQIKGSGLEDTIDQLNDFIVRLPDDSEKNKATKRCFNSITAFDYLFIDPASEVSLRQLLALTFLAIRDENNRDGNLQDAENQLIEGLYEIQRGYNLLETGQDQGGEDVPICPAGAFNKLIEKLQGIHVDCEVRFMTSKTVSFKLPIVVQEAALHYLSQLANPVKTADLLAFTHLIQQIKIQGIEVIWDNIKDLVTDRLFNEFASLYKDRENKDFTDLVDAGRYTTLTDGALNVFQEKIKNSKGYHHYCSHMLRQGSLFFSSNRQDRPVNNSQNSCPQTDLRVSNLI
jgi:hypothetical protein